MPRTHARYLRILLLSFARRVGRHTDVLPGDAEPMLSACESAVRQPPPDSVQGHRRHSASPGRPHDLVEDADVAQITMLADSRPSVKNSRRTGESSLNRCLVASSSPITR